jgi:hypothetical protein
MLMIMIFTRIACLISCVALLSSALPIFAQSPVEPAPAASGTVSQTAPPSQNAGPVYAVLSLVGDRLDIVRAQHQTGSRIDKNYRTIVDIADPVFDNTVIDAVGREIRKIDKRAEIAALNTRSPVLFEKHKVLFAESGGLVSIPGAIKDAIAGQKATHFVLITKHNDEAVLRFRDGYEGVGRLEGLGFYLDAINGYSNIVAYVYIKLSLVDMSSQRLVSTALIRASTSFRDRNDPGASSARAWEVLTGGEKVVFVNGMLREEIGKAVPNLLQSGTK